MGRGVAGGRGGEVSVVWEVGMSNGWVLCGVMLVGLGGVHQYMPYK